MNKNCKINSFFLCFIIMGCAASSGSGSSAPDSPDALQARLTPRSLPQHTSLILEQAVLVRGTLNLIYLWDWHLHPLGTCW